VLWFLFANVILSFDFRTVWAIAVWTGFGLIASGLVDLVTSRLVDQHRWIHVVLGVVSIAGGVACLVWPGVTFVVLASLVSWVLLFRGGLLIALGIATRRVDEFWWLSLVLGVLLLAVAFWAAQYPGRSTALLVVWVGIAAVSKGVENLFLAFHLRSLRVRAA
jgi:uncharacterized membrane protein HdeD (DUF308 family)